MSERVFETLSAFLEPGETLEHWAFGQSFKAGRITLYMVFALIAAGFIALFFGPGILGFIAFWGSFILIGGSLGATATTQVLFGLTDRRLIIARYRPDMWQFTPRFNKPLGAAQAAPLPASNVISVKTGSLKSIVRIKGVNPAKVTCGMLGQVAWQKEHVLALAAAAPQS